MNTKKIGYRFMLISLPLLMIMLWTIYHGGSVYINKADDLQSIAEYDQTRIRLEVPQRGTIFSSDGQILAATVPSYRVQVNTSGLVVTDANAIEPIVSLLAPVLDIPASKLREQLVSAMEKKQSTVLAAAVPEAKLKPLGLSTVGIYANLTPIISYTRKISNELRSTQAPINYFISISPVSKREYPNGALAAPVIGSTRYSDTIVYSEMMTQSGKPFTETRRAFLTEGISGLESAFDHELQGVIGVRKGRSPLERTVITKTVPAIDIVSTIDTSIQYVAERALDQAYQKYKLTGGTIIVMDIKNGDIFAMATRTERPVYDPNQPLLDAIDLLNPAITWSYAQQPGSVIKPIVVASAIEHGRAIESFDDPGTIMVRGTRISNYMSTAHGKVDLMKLFLHSINTYTVKNAQSLGPELFYQQYKLFGLNDVTGSELVREESRGNMLVKGDKEWTEAVMASDSFGQSMTVTPLQTLRAIAALGNEGVLVQPRFVREHIIDGVHKIMPPGPQHNAVGPAAAQRTLGLMRDSMVEKIRQDKTAGVNNNIAGYTYAGKTGTAQWYKNGVLHDTHLVTFAGLIPANEPRLAILVKLNEPKIKASNDVLAGTTALPVWRDVAEQAVKLLNIPPDSK